MAEVSKDFISALVLLARAENAADPCAWLQERQREVVADAVAREDGREQSMSLNSKSVTFFPPDLSTDQKISACAAACRVIEEEAAEAADEAVPAFTNGRVRYVDFRYAGFS